MQTCEETWTPTFVDEPTEDTEDPFVDPEVLLHEGELSHEQRVENRLRAQRAYRALIDLADERQIIQECGDEEIARLQRLIDNQHDFMAQEMARIDCDRGRVYYEGILRQFTAQETAGQKRRCVDFPGGLRCSLKKQQPDWVWPARGEEPEELMEWARENCSIRVIAKAGGGDAKTLENFAATFALKTERELDKLAIKKACKVREDGTVVDTETGEIVPCLRVVERDDAFDYDLPK